MRVRSGIAAFLATLGFVTVGAAEASACTGEQPTFAEAVAGASAIARIVLVDEPTDRTDDPGERHTVLRTLKGTLANEIELEDPRATLCGDRVGFWVDEGQEAIVAYGVEFYETTLNVTWAIVPDPVRPLGGSATIPEGVSTLDDLERAIVAALPDTAVAPTTPAPTSGYGAILLAASALIIGRWRFAPRTARGS